MQDYFESIIVPLDFGPRTSAVIKQAYIFGQLMNCDVVLQYVHDSAVETAPGNIAEKEAKLQELAKTAGEKYNLNFYPYMCIGNVTDSIVHFSKSNYAKMIIMGNQGSTDNQETIFGHIGDNTSKIIREAECPVLTISSEIIYDLDKILLPLDLSKPVGQKLNWAIYFSRFFGCIIKVITISRSTEENRKEKYHEKMHQVKTMLNDCNVFCTTDILIKQDPNIAESKMIVDYSKQNDCDMIMIMTRQETKHKDFNVGRTAAGIISLSEKPVISITPNIKSEMSKSC
jgi:nucleotide-binding universal stress UspA family protein